MSADKAPYLHRYADAMDDVLLAFGYTEWLLAHRASHRCPLRCALLELFLALGACS